MTSEKVQGTTASVAVGLLDTLVIGSEREDHNGHMNVEHYFVLVNGRLAKASDTWGYSPDEVKSNRRGLFSAEHRLHYVNEVHVGQQVSIYGWLLERSGRALRGVGVMVNDDAGRIAFVQEFVAVQVDLGTRRSTAFDDARAARIDQLIADAAPASREVAAHTRLRLGKRS